MLKFALRHMAVRRTKLIMICLSIIITACVALLAYNISTQISEGIIQTAANFDIIIGPSGSSTQLAMNTMFFTDKPLGTIPYSLVEEIESSGMANAVVPFSMGDSYNDAPIVGTTPALLDGKSLSSGEMFNEACEAVVGYDVAKKYNLSVGDTLITSHGLSGSGSDHADSPLTVTGILSRTHTAYDNAVFTPCETIWALHDHEEEHEESEEHVEGEEHEEEHDEEKTVCAVLVRSKSIADYSALTAAYSENSDYLVINPNTVLREVLENVDMSRKIVYILCAVILIMNVFVITLIALLSAYDSRGEIALMRLIGVSMGRINLLYLIQNAVAGAIALILALLAAHGCLLGIRSFVASMGIVLNAAKIYSVEWAILLLVFVISILPTSIMTLRMSRQDSIDR
ncbi:MAG: ABC transporter permease [Clostridia bacterium]|nr:ABC transporter permease [Clostridia bacterium]